MADGLRRRIFGKRAKTKDKEADEPEATTSEEDQEDEEDDAPAASVAGIGGLRPRFEGIREQIVSDDLQLGFRPPAADVEDAAPPAGGATAPVVVQDAVRPVVEAADFERLIQAAEQEELSDEDRQAAEDALTAFGVDPTGLSDAELASELDRIAQEQLLGADSDDALTATPTTEAIAVAAEVSAAGGNFVLNGDGSITLFREDGSELSTIPAGSEGGDAFAAAIQAAFNLPATSPVPTIDTVVLIAEAQADGGSAVVHVDGSVDIFDSDGNLVQTVPTDIGSEVQQAFETAGEGLASVPEQVAAIPGELSQELDAAGEQVGDAVDNIADQVGGLIDAIFGSDDDDPAASPGQEGAAPAAPGQEGAAPAGDAADDGGDGDGDPDDEDEDDDDGDDDDEPAAEEEAPPPAAEDEDDPANAAGAGEEGTPNPLADGPRATEEFLDSPLGQEQQEQQEESLALAGSGGVTDPPEGEGGGTPGGTTIDPTTGETAPGPVRGPVGGEPLIDAPSLAVTNFDLENLEVLAGGGPAAGPGEPDAPSPISGRPILDPRAPLPSVPPIAGPGVRGDLVASALDDVDDDLAASFGAGARPAISAAGLAGIRAPAAVAPAAAAPVAAAAQQDLAADLDFGGGAAAAEDDAPAPPDDDPASPDDDAGDDSAFVAPQQAVLVAPVASQVADIALDLQIDPDALDTDELDDF